ncbi:phage/plasmid primase, P4 family [Lactobacillus delbrueckii subsp. bulgaricus]|nr:hypothetical protein [Lactobacillus delbrueckii subsp. bulgaricus]
MTVYIQTGLHNSKLTPHDLTVVGYLQDYQPKQFAVNDSNWWDLKHKSADYIIAGRVRELGARNNNNVLSRSALFLDLDDINPDITSLQDLQDRLSKIKPFNSCEWLLWPTIKNNLGYRDRDKNGNIIPATSDNLKARIKHDLETGKCEIQDKAIWYHPRLRARICIPLAEEITDQNIYKALVNAELEHLITERILTDLDKSNSTWSQVEGLPINEKPYHHAGTELRLYKADLEYLKKTQKPKDDFSFITTPITAKGKGHFSTPGEVIGAIRTRSKDQAKLAKFEDLMNGGGTDDNSSNDLALMNIVAFWAGCNPELMDGVYRLSKQPNNIPGSNGVSKWDEPGHRAIDGATYGQITIEKAINDCHDIYTPGGNQQEQQQGKQALKVGLWTENYVSDYLVERHGDDLKHTTDPDKWYIYKKETGTWEADNTSAVGRMARETIDWLHEQIPTVPAGSDTGEMLSEWNKFLRKIGNSSAKSRIIREAGEYLDIAITQKDFNRAGMLINTPDKAINLSTGNEIDDRKHLLFDQHTNYSPDTERDAPRWSRFLLETFQGDTEMIRWIQKVLGYAITGETGEQVFFIMLGEGQNGKSVLASVMQKLLGNYAHSANINTFLDTGTQSGSAPTPDIVSMDGKRFVFTAEPKKYAKLDTNKIRLFTGEDTLVGRDLHEKGQREFASHFKLFISANHMLKLDMDDYSIARRVVVIPFKHIVKNKDVNQHLVDDLLEEAPAIMNWLLEGVQAWKKEGLKTHWNPVTESLASGYPQQVSEAILEFKTATDNVLRWIDDDCSLEDPDHRETNKRLYADYKQWCINNGEKPEASRVWGKTMSKHGFKTWRSTSERGFIGIKITDPADQYKTNFK